MMQEQAEILDGSNSGTILMPLRPVG